MQQFRNMLWSRQDLRVFLPLQGFRKIIFMSIILAGWKGFSYPTLHKQRLLEVEHLIGASRWNERGTARTKEAQGARDDLLNEGWNGRTWQVCYFPISLESVMGRSLSPSGDPAQFGLSITTWKCLDVSFERHGWVHSASEGEEEEDEALCVCVCVVSV